MSAENKRVVYADPTLHALAEHDPIRIKGWAHDLVAQAEEALIVPDPLPVRIGKMACGAANSFMEAMAAAGSPDALDAYKHKRTATVYA